MAVVEGITDEIGPRLLVGSVIMSLNLLMENKPAE